MTKMAINRYQELKTATVYYELNLSSQFPLISVEELLQLMDDSFGNKDYLHSLDILLYLNMPDIPENSASDKHVLK